METIRRSCFNYGESIGYRAVRWSIHIRSRGGASYNRNIGVQHFINLVRTVMNCGNCNA